MPDEKVRQVARLLEANRPVSLYMHNGVGQHTNATQTSRAIATLYALLGDFDQPGGNVVFPKASVKAVAGKEFLPREVALQRIGRERKPLGPPAKPGNCVTGHGVCSQTACGPTACAVRPLASSCFT